MHAFNNKLMCLRLPKLVLATVLAAMISACGGSGVADPPDPPGQNAAPTISGNPPTTATVGVAYSFQPNAQDPEGATLAFSIQNKPGWAVFSTATGQLSGTPSSAGTVSNIIISVSDGANTTNLAAFSLTTNAAAATGSAQLSWTAPTLNTDGSNVSLAGFRVYYGTSAGALTSSLDVPGASTTSATVGSLAAGTWYFSVAAYASGGIESVLSNPVSKIIP